MKHTTDDPGVRPPFPPGPPPIPTLCKICGNPVQDFPLCDDCLEAFVEAGIDYEGIVDDYLYEVMA